MAKGTVRNVYNTDAVDNFCANVSLLANHSDVADWIRVVARNWILRDHNRFDLIRRERATDRFVRVDPDMPRWEEARPLDPPYPDWLARAIDAGGEVVFLRLDGRLNRDIRRVIEYLDHEFDRNPRRRLDRIGFKQAAGQADAWRRVQRQRREGPVGPGEIPVYREGGRSGGGLIVVQLTTRRSLTLEGERMNHCVAIYDDEVAMGECEIYSVRNADGASLATIEVDPDGNVLQVKGKANGPLSLAARRAVTSFIRSRAYHVVGDHLNVSTVLPNLGSSERDLAAWLLTPAGRGYMRTMRFGGGDFGPHIDQVGLVDLINQWMFELSDSDRESVFRAFLPGPAPPVRLRHGRTFRPYGVLVEAVFVDIPLPLVRLHRLGFFYDLTVEDDVADLLRRIENTLPTLCFRELDRVYILGRPRVTPAPWWVEDITSTADILIESPYDISRQRANRHQTMLEQLNRLKTDLVSRSAPADEDHIALRRLITGQEGVYAI